MKKTWNNLRMAAVLAFSMAASGLSARTFILGNSRITFITENLVRLEYANRQKFLNDSTLFAVIRKDYDVAVNHQQEGRKHIFTTSAMRLEFNQDGFPFGQNNLRAEFMMKGKKQGWCLTDGQSGNLKGALCTLDGVGGPVEREEGLLSRNGWYLINDTGKDVYKNGTLTLRDRNHVQDLYLFIYGTDYKAALKSLAAISGPVPMTRKYVHGAWYCRWWQYTAQDYRDLVNGYHEHGFPLDIMVFDMDWHKKKFSTGTGHAYTRGWTGYSWNRELIPDPAGLIAEFKKKNVHVVLNEHPHDGLRPEEDAYKAFARDLGTEYTQNGTPVFDAGDPHYMSRFMKYAHQESDSMGVAFWWLDWQQDYAYPLVRGTSTKHLPWLNEIYYNYSMRPAYSEGMPEKTLRGAGFSRWGGWGDHRHPIQFSGDAVGNWEMLRFEVDLTTTSGNSGCFFWAHDIGGFYDGMDPELYTRWTQFGLLNSSLRIHSVAGKDNDRRPWLWGEREEKAMRHIYQLRSQLMPYVYSSVRQCHTDMLPLNRGLYIEQPEAEESYKHPGEFYFGDLILGAPVTEAGTGPDKTVEQEVWFPAGCNWYSLFTGKAYEGGKTATVSSPLEESPVFVKGGWPLPLQPVRERMASAPLDTLVIRCYPGQNGDRNTYTLYEDDGITLDYQKGQYATTALTYQKKDAETSVQIASTQGKYDGQEKQRAYRIELPGVKVSSKISVNGKKVRARYSEDIQGIVIPIKKTDIRKEIRIRIQEKKTE